MQKSARAVARESGVPTPTSRRDTREYYVEMSEMLLRLIVAGRPHRLSGSAREAVLIRLGVPEELVQR